MDKKRPVRVLITDDNLLTRSLLKVILRSAEYDVIGEAGDTTTAMGLARVLRPDVIFLDNSMPGETGLSILKPLKAMLPGVLILMVTTSHDDATVQAAMDGGANGFVVKPFNTESVLGTLKKATEKFVMAAAATRKP